MEWARAAYGMLSAMLGRKRAEPLVDSWNVFEGTHAGRRMIVRVNEGAAAMAGDRRYGIKVSVAVPLNDPRPDGMPNPDEMRQMAVAEVQIAGGLAGNGVLVLVITTSGAREFVAYTGSTKWLPELEERLRSAVTTHAVRIDSREDEEWGVYRHFTG